MSSSKQTIIIRHRKENRKKCSLTSLEKREDFRFFSYPFLDKLDLSSYIILRIDAPVLNLEDAKLPLCLIDATWQYSEKIYKKLPNKEQLQYRSLPDYFVTAYPRKQTHCLDPQRGLASIEALYLASFILGKEDTSLLKHYFWKKEFLSLNKKHLSFFHIS